MDVDSIWTRFEFRTKQKQDVPKNFWKPSTGKQIPTVYTLNSTKCRRKMDNSEYGTYTFNGFKSYRLTPKTQFLTKLSQNE